MHFFRSGSRILHPFQTLWFRCRLAIIIYRALILSGKFGSLENKKEIIFIHFSQKSSRPPSLAWRHFDVRWRCTEITVKSPISKMNGVQMTKSKKGVTNRYFVCRVASWSGQRRQIGRLKLMSGPGRQFSGRYTRALHRSAESWCTSPTTRSTSTRTIRLRDWRSRELPPKSVQNVGVRLDLLNCRLTKCRSAPMTAVGTKVWIGGVSNYQRNAGRHLVQVGWAKKKWSSLSVCLEKGWQPEMDDAFNIWLDRAGFNNPNPAWFSVAWTHRLLAQDILESL